jgi:RNA polymerase sigma-70 factor (ECF subfamily)
MENEDRLARALARRDRASWAKVYDRHVGEVFGLVYHLVGRDRTVAEDLTQEVWLLAIERIRSFDSTRGRLRDWLLGIARHRALRHHRDCARVINARVDGASNTLPPVDLLEGSERTDMVRAALLCVASDRRRLLLDKYADGLSVDQIAARMGRSAKAVESLLSRARAELRAYLRPYFTNPSGGRHHE